MRQLSVVLVASLTLACGLAAGGVLEHDHLDRRAADLLHDLLRRGQLHDELFLGGARR